MDKSIPFISLLDKKCFTISLLCIICCTSFWLQGQSLGPTITGNSGAFYSSSGASLEWTIGEPITSTLSNSSNTLTQGFHQTKLFVIGITEAKTSFELFVYPNPVANFLTVEARKSNGLNVELHSSNGSLLFNSPIESGDKINMTTFPKGSYVLRVNDNSGTTQSFQIIKH